MFSDGRQCTMARSDIHPSLCTYHSDREEQLFGDPTYRRETRALDFPELYSACRDLSTAAGVNRALAQVFRLLAQRRISRQEAATFGHLAKLLLRTISLMNAESERDAEASVVIPSEYHERGIPPEVLPHGSGGAAIGGADELGLAGEGAEESFDSSAKADSLKMTPPSFGRRVSRGAATASLSPAQRIAKSNSPKISTYAAPHCNSPEISTYENAKDQVMQNEHLQKNVRDSHVCAR
jgi:hypothetical protein